MNKLIDNDNVASEFMSPFEENLEFIFIGDNLDKNLISQLKSEFNSSRNNWNKLPNIKPKLSRIQYSKFSTSELFNNKVTHKLENNPCIIYLGPDVAKLTIEYLIDEPNLMDPLDEMLIEKYIINQPQEKFIIDLSQIDKTHVDKFTNYMDIFIEKFNYIIENNLLYIWIFNVDDLPPTW
jgi:hypothetical protein